MTTFMYFAIVFRKSPKASTCDTVSSLSVVVYKQTAPSMYFHVPSILQGTWWLGALGKSC